MAGYHELPLLPFPAWHSWEAGRTRWIRIANLDSHLATAVGIAYIITNRDGWDVGWLGFTKAPRHPTHIKPITGTFIGWVGGFNAKRLLLSALTREWAIVDRMRSSAVFQCRFKLHIIYWCKCICFFQGTSAYIDLLRYVAFGQVRT